MSTANAIWREAGKNAEMNILAIDPGTEESAWVTYDPVARRVIEMGIHKNDALLRKLRQWRAIRDRGTRFPQHLALEMLACYGMVAGASILETAVWIGRFLQAWGEEHTTLVYRREVKLHLLGKAAGTDAGVRAALLHQIGPKGRKDAPGPTYGCRKDIWAALGVAVTYSETREVR